MIACSISKSVNSSGLMRGFSAEGRGICGSEEEAPRAERYRAVTPPRALFVVQARVSRFDQRLDDISG
jgi:hypothetical protein